MEDFSLDRLPALVDEARRAIEEASTFEEVKEIHSQMEVMRIYVKKIGAGLVAQNRCAEIKIRAERRMGDECERAGFQRGGHNKANHHDGRLLTHKELGVNHNQTSRWRLISGLSAEQFEAYIERQRIEAEEITSNGAYTLAKRLLRKDDIATQREAIKSGDVTLPAGVFEVISIDPPWPYGNEDQYDVAGYRVASPYPEMSLEELAAMEIPAAPNCVLWLWTTHKFMRHSFDLLDAWGFEDKAILTWAKDRMGTGRWLRSKSEFCIMSVKGQPMIDLTNQTTILEAPLREHSRKPDEFYSLVESLCVGRMLDFFSRESREGWAQIGNEPEKFDGMGRQAGS